jgi:hypothetical protein
VKAWGGHQGLRIEQERIQPHPLGVPFTTTALSDPKPNESVTKKPKTIATKSGAPEQVPSSAVGTATSTAHKSPAVSSTPTAARQTPSHLSFQPRQAASATAAKPPVLSSSTSALKPLVPSAPRAMVSVVSAPRSVFVAPTGAPTGPASLRAKSPSLLRPEGPELPPMLEGPLHFSSLDNGTASPSKTTTKAAVSGIAKQAGSSKGKSPKVDLSLKYPSTTLRRGRSRSRSDSVASSRSDSRSRSSRRRRTLGEERRGPRHRLPRRRSSSSPEYRPKRSRSYSRSRSRSRRTPSTSRLRRYRSKRSRTRSISLSRSRSPTYRRRNYSYSRPPSPSMRRESPATQGPTGRHWSPDDERHARSRRRNSDSISPTPPRILPSRDHWSPSTHDKPRRRASGPYWATNKLEDDNDFSVDAEMLAQPMKPRGKSTVTGKRQDSSASPHCS